MENNVAIKIRRYFVLINFLVLISCDNPVVPKFKTELSVYAVLIPGAEHQEIYVYRTYENIPDSISREDLFVKDALVTVSTFDQHVDFTCVYDTSQKRSKYIDLTEQLIVIPGKQYELKIENSIGILKGKTIVPDSIRILSPEIADSIKDKSDLKIKWDAGKNAAGYIINLYSPPQKIISSDNQYAVIRHSYCFYTTNTFFIIPGKYIRFYESSPFGEFIEKNRRYTLKVIALDVNFKQNLFDGSDISGVTNGYGLFGSVSVDSLDFYVIKNQ